MSKEEAKDRLIEILTNQVEDLSMMSKIELGDDVIAEIKRLNDIIEPKQRRGTNYLMLIRDSLMFTIMFALAMVGLTGCSKHFVTTAMMSVDVKASGAYYDDAMIMFIDASWVPTTWGENIEPYQLDIFVTATPVIDTSSLPPLHHTYTIDNTEFRSCNDEVFYCTHRVFPHHIPRADQYLYDVTYDHQVR